MQYRSIYATFKLLAQYSFQVLLWKWNNNYENEEMIVAVKAIYATALRSRKKIRTSTGFESVTSRLPVRCSTNWTMKPLTLGAGQLWVHMFPWKKWVLLIYEIYHIWTAEMKWKWRNYRRSERNLCNCVKKPEKRIQNFRIIVFLETIQCKELLRKTAKTCQFMPKKYCFKNELKYSKRLDHVTDDVMSLLFMKKIIR